MTKELSKIKQKNHKQTKTTNVYLDVKCAHMSDRITMKSQLISPKANL